jgi:hypothetical protein
MTKSQEPDTRPFTYLKAFFTDMLTGMSGPLSVPFALLALWASGRGQKILYGLLALLCLLFASYRVWRKERKDANARLAVTLADIALRDAELSDLRERVAHTVRAAPQRPKLRMMVSADGNPPSQVLQIATNQPVTVSRVEYMLNSEATIDGEDMSKQGNLIAIPINDKLLLKVWNTPRPDRNQNDHSGPAKIGITVSLDGHTGQYILPIQMDVFWQANTMFRKVIGSKTFYEG